MSLTGQIAPERVLTGEAGRGSLPSSAVAGEAKALKDSYFSLDNYTLLVSRLIQIKEHSTGNLVSSSNPLVTPVINSIHPCTNITIRISLQVYYHRHHDCVK